MGAWQGQARAMSNKIIYSEDRPDYVDPYPLTPVAATAPPAPASPAGAEDPQPQGDEPDEPDVLPPPAKVPKIRRTFEEKWRTAVSDAECRKVCSPNSCSQHCRAECWKKVIWDTVLEERNDVAKNGDTRSKEYIYDMLKHNKSRHEGEAEVTQHFVVAKTCTCRGFFEAVYQQRSAMTSHMLNLVREGSEKYRSSSKRKASASFGASRSATMVAWMKAVAGDGCQSGMAEYIPHRHIFRLHHMTKREVYKVRKPPAEHQFRTNSACSD